MNDEDTDEQVLPRTGCLACRWVALLPQLYGSIEYLCERRQELIPSAGIDRRRCSDFAYDAG